MAAGLRLALIAHDEKKDDMVAFASRPCRLPRRLRHRRHRHDRPARARKPARSLRSGRLKSGPLGGDQQIGALIAEGMIDALIFFVDPLTPMPHDVDVKALMRLAIVYDIPMALNRATAEIVSLEREEERLNAA